MRYWLKLTSFVQYFVGLGKSIFLHFRSISNKLKKVVSIRVEIYYELFSIDYLIRYLIELRFAMNETA
ncbi:hypothetical protein T02_15313 [Trichinella nativa]|uniref:Uncharacterized protein n=1 Tax=Trichinella nativa TaxID=6335 RepID=A0A0V1LR98_9BILA|nr:hypothetical protein T02_15313 [Trichinella nativa]